MNTLKNSTIWRVLAISLALGALTACNTMEGAGRDVQALGNAIENEAEEEDEYSNDYD